MVGFQAHILNQPGDYVAIATATFFTSGTSSSLRLNLVQYPVPFQLVDHNLEVLSALESLDSREQVLSPSPV